mmetsp:Transcript_45224/g.86476  ORF Transcript_45224/g.86476 Transcript_45224/m.86476 type:complete len:203 (+) Transcript_45224:56-664(+)
MTSVEKISKFQRKTQTSSTTLLDPFSVHTRIWPYNNILLCYTYSTVKLSFIVGSILIRVYASASAEAVAFASFSAARSAAFLRSLSTNSFCKSLAAFNFESNDLYVSKSLLTSSCFRPEADTNSFSASGSVRPAASSARKRPMARNLLCSNLPDAARAARAFTAGMAATSAALVADLAAASKSSASERTFFGSSFNELTYAL